MVFAVFPCSKKRLFLFRNGSTPMINFSFDLRTSIDLIIYYMDLLRVNNIPIRYFFQGFAVLVISVYVIRAAITTLMNQIGQGTGQGVASQVFSELRDQINQHKD